MVIFIPGYYGSALKEVGSSRRVFITAREALFGREALSLFQNELATPKSPELEVDGVLDSVAVIPGLFTVDVYGKFQENLTIWTKNRSARVIPFGYDWREDLPATVRRLSELIEHFSAAGAPRVDIVAHSMGSLVTTYYLAYGAQQPESARINWAGARRVTKVIFLGAPFNGVFSIFRNMQRGAPALGGNHSLLPAETVASFPASYQVMPIAMPEFIGTGGTQEILDLWEPTYWHEHHLGLLAATSQLPAEIVANREKFTKTQLVRAHKVAELLQLKAPSDQVSEAAKNLKVLSVVGTGHPTLQTAFFDKTKDQFIFDVDKPSRHGLNVDVLNADGDGTVTVASATLPEAFQQIGSVITTTEGHGELFNDKTVKKTIEEFLK